MGEKPFGISPGKSMIKPAKAETFRIQLGCLDGKTMKLVFDNALKVSKGQRVQCFFYNTREPKLQGPVIFHHKFEEVPEVSQPAEVDPDD